MTGSPATCPVRWYDRCRQALSKRDSREPGLAQVDKEFAIPLLAEQRAGRDAEHLTAEQLGGAARTGDNGGMLIGVANHAPLPHLPAADFELRLDQVHHLGAGGEQRQGWRQHLVEGDEGGIDDSQIGKHTKG